MNSVVERVLKGENVRSVLMEAPTVPASNEECAERIAAINFRLKDFIDDLYSGWEAIDPKECEADLVNHDTKIWKDLLFDIKDYLNAHYDDEDPDCASALHEVELLLAYLKQF